jgi:hypothetical protein
MRFWPKKKWKKIVLATFLVLLVALVIVGGYFEYSVYRELNTPLDVLNAEGTQIALIIYHPGLTSYAHDAAYAYAQGLVSAGWRVEVATASPQAPTNITRYSLCVLFYPLYDFNPGPTITTQIHRIGNLQGTNTVIVVLGGGLDPLDAPSKMTQTVQNANGTVIELLKAYRGTDYKSNLEQKASQLTP